MPETNGPNKSTPKEPFALHAKKGSSHAIVIANIKVLILNDDGSWFAQGLDIDYSAQGESLEAVKTLFESGLEKTLKEHIKTHGDIGGVLQVAPKECWDKYYQQPRQWVYTYGGVHVVGEPQQVDLQFQYLQPQEAALAV